jgi:hypothetical protein
MASLRSGIGTVVIESRLALASVAIVGVYAVGVCFITLVYLWVSALIEEAESAWPTSLRACIAMRRAASALISARQVDTLRILVTVVESGRLTLVDDEIAHSARMRGFLVMVAAAAPALVSLWLVDAVGKARAVVEAGMGALVDVHGASSTRALFRIWRLVNRVDGTFAGVPLPKVLAHCRFIAVVEALVETFIDMLDAHPARFAQFIRRLITVAIAAPAGVAITTLRLTAYSGWVAVILRRIDTHWL